MARSGAHEYQQDPKHFSHWQDLVSEAVKQPHARTNQFEVTARLTGLQEKFRILNNDTLADALRDRLDELERIQYSWAPEVLSLLLELSDQPAQKSRLEDLELLKPPDSPRPLTWSDILADDPLDDADGIWSNVDFAAGSSDDGGSVVTPEDVAQRSEATNVFADDEGDLDLRQAYIVPEENKPLEEIIGSQFWTSQVHFAQDEANGLDDASKLDDLWRISELEAVREVLFMLGGLPTSLFKREDNVNVSTNMKYALQHSSVDAFHHVLHSFTAIGTTLNELRAWTTRKQDVPLMQTFRAATEERIRSFNSALSDMQTELIASQQEVVVSLLAVQNGVRISVRPLLQLSNIVAKLDGSAPGEPFRALEALFQQASLCQASGDTEGFEYMCHIFFQCFQTYLKPLQDWVERGELGNNGGTFFVSMNEETVEPALLWSEQYHLEETTSGRLLAPAFLHAAAKKICKIGKSVVFLKRLGAFEELSREDRNQAFKMDFESVYGSTSLVPFSELFDLAFDKWMDGKRHNSLSVLRHCIFTDCGLWRSLDALEYIYFMKDGALSNTAATIVFDRIDSNKGAWNDRFILTELVRSVYASHQSVVTEQLTVRSSVGGYRDTQNRRRSVKILASMSIEYTIPWAVANIVGRPSTRIYQRIFTFLLQVRRAKHLLERHRLLTQSNSPSDNTNHENNQLYSLRLRLLWFVNTLYTYLTESVLAPSTAKMRTRIAGAEDLDAMIAIHASYIAHLEDQCLLSKKIAPIHQAIISLLDLVIQFSDTQAHYAGERLADLTNLSMVSAVSQRVSQRRRRRSRKGSAAYVASSDDSDDDRDDQGQDVDTSYITPGEKSYVDRLRKMREQFDKLSGFVGAGVQAISRSGGVPSWEVLAERLAWGKGTKEW